MINYGFSKEMDKSYEETLMAVEEALGKQGFGILTRIDLKEKFKEKLGVDFTKYVILGACNPPNAHKAILVEENIGLMLPCNVIIYERGAKTVLSVVRPTAAMGMIDNEELRKVAGDVEQKLKKVFDSVA